MSRNIEFEQNGFKKREVFNCYAGDQSDDDINKEEVTTLSYIKNSV
jgi:hypothetical protein